MKKKIKNLTFKEMEKICSKNFPLCNLIKCPLWYDGSCLISFIKKLQYIESEVKINGGSRIKEKIVR